MPRRYELPDCLAEKTTHEIYLRWLRRKAIAHVRRDRQRGNTSTSISEYTQEIHRAVTTSGGQDFYTGKPLDWSLISTYDNDASQAGGRNYKKALAALPTVDHLDDGMGPPTFVITSWRVNDAKHDLTLEEFQELCAAVLRHQGFLVERTRSKPKLLAMPDVPGDYRSGATATTQIGFTNRNRQRCWGTRGLPGTDHVQFAYRLECLKCGCTYGANGSDIFLRKCPGCQGGAPGISGEA